MKAREKFCQQYQREATIEEISEITKITREEIVTSLEASNEVESIHQDVYKRQVSKKTDYLINNDKMSQSSKNKKAMELNIPIPVSYTHLDEWILLHCLPLRMLRSLLL